MEKIHYSISVKVIYRKAQHKKYSPQAALKHNLKENIQPSVSRSLLDICQTKAAIYKSKPCPAAAERAIYFHGATSSQNNDQKHTYDWTRSALLLENCNNFSNY